MKIIRRNIREAGRNGFVRRVCGLIRNYHPHILFFFMETKVNLDKAKFIIKKLNYPFFIEIPSIGLTEVLWMISSNSLYSFFFLYYIYH